LLPLPGLPQPALPAFFHEDGFTIAKDFQDRWAFFRPDGIAVLEKSRDPTPKNRASEETRVCFR